MFDVRDSFDDQANEAISTLPHAAMRCLRACTCSDHALAEGLRHGHTRRPAPRLHVASKRAELRAREIAQEAR